MQVPASPSALLLQRVTVWAEEREDVVAAVLTGSSARGEHAVDEFSDLDVELFTTDPGLYSGYAWLEELGQVMVCLPFEENERAYVTRLVFFEGGVKFDFQVRPAAHLDELARSPSADDIWGRGFRFLVDKVGAGSAIAPASITTPPNEPVSEEAFEATVNEFWFEAAHIPRYLLRDELWVVKFRDWTMKCDLLRMIEWYARANRGDDQDVWFIGAKMKSWAGEEVWADVQRVFARFDRTDSWRALLATIALFDRLTRRVADAHGFTCPDTADKVSAYVRSFAPRLAREALG